MAHEHKDTKEVVPEAEEDTQELVTEAEEDIQASMKPRWWSMRLRRRTPRRRSMSPSMMTLRRCSPSPRRRIPGGGPETEEEDNRRWSPKPRRT